MVEFDNTRRRLVIAAGAGLVLAGASPQIARAAEKHDDEKEVSAVEDLMREHGVIRRALLVYREGASRLRVTRRASIRRRCTRRRDCSAPSARTTTSESSKKPLSSRRSARRAALRRFMSMC